MEFYCVPTTIAGFAISLAVSLFIYFMQQSAYLAGPHCNLQLLYVPALDLAAAPPPPPPENSTNATANPFLFFELSFHNVLSLRGVNYGEINLTFFYRHKAVGNYVIPGFYQGSQETAQRRDVVETSGVPWGDAVAAVASGSTAVFRVEVAARPTFKNLLWDTDPKEVNVAADVEVDGDGVKVGKDDIRLTSSSSDCGGIRVLVGFICGLIATNLLY